MPVCHICGASRRRLTALFLWPRHGSGCGTWYCNACWATKLPVEFRTDAYGEIVLRQCNKCEVWMEEVSSTPPPYH